MIVNWRLRIGSPITESGRVDAQPNEADLDSIEIEFVLVNRFNTHKDQETTDD